MRWHDRDPWLLWSYPLAFGGHLAEESWGGDGLLLGVEPLSTSGFLVLSTVALGLSMLAVTLAARREAFGWVAVALASLVTLNAVWHLVRTLATRSYSPGLVTGIVLSLPLGQITLLRAGGRAAGRTFWIGVLLGSAAQALVTGLASGVNLWREVPDFRQLRRASGASEACTHSPPPADRLSTVVSAREVPFWGAWLNVEQGGVMRNIYRGLALILILGLAGSAASVLAQDVKQPTTVILKGAPMGGVKFEHLLHTTERGAKCETCHHPSRPEMAAKTTYQKCTDCHTKAATAPMKTKLQAAFHNPMAKVGVCVDCHQAQNAKGAKAPMKCPDCHKKENV